MVSAIQAGERLAFVRLINEYERLVLHIVSPLIEGEHDRADVCQDVFIKVHRQLGSFQFRSRLSTWIGSIAYNTAINFLRKKKSLLLEDILGNGKTDDGDFNPDIADTAGLPDALLMQKQTHEILHRSIDTLPAVQKTILRLFHADELPLEEISLIVGMPVNTVKSHLFRARRNLKNTLLSNKFSKP